MMRGSLQMGSSSPIRGIRASTFDPPLYIRKVLFDALRTDVAAMNERPSQIRSVCRPIERCIHILLNTDRMIRPLRACRARHR